ncbi:MAG: zinc ribbon domain-containing protein [Acidimicrobiia bacterium]|nr:zinc ribbon domain-containing protein [Acidimicrobiia bacterium]
MPMYEFRCRTCDEIFEERRAMSAANDPAKCPQGHENAVRLLSVFASVGSGNSGSTAPTMPAPKVGGCGSGCGCHS